MSIKRHADSHLDHNLTPGQVDFVLSQDPAPHVNPDSGVAVFTVELPEGLGTAPCGIYGPIVGDAPVSTTDVSMERRGNRKGLSRIVARPVRQSRLVTIVAGPHDGHPFVLFTAYGGPLAPREPFDFDENDTSDSAVESRDFWAMHALARGS
jgi:hypothetical protein